MPEAKNQFFNAKMNKDIETRLVDNREYLDALNININKSGADSGRIGAIENVKGNVLAYSQSLGHSNCDTIGVYVSERDNRIYWAVTNFTLSQSSPNAIYGDYCAILYYDQNAGIVNEVVSGHFLNFSRTHLLTFNMISDILFFTDNLNQPRKVNVTYALSNPGVIATEDQIAVTRFCPYLPVDLLPGGASGMQVDAGIESTYIKEKFVRFSYRFKFIDGEYSTIAPFSQICFNPKELVDSVKAYKKIYKSSQLENMLNESNLIIFNVPLPSSNVTKEHFITDVEVLIKESDSPLVKVVGHADLTHTTANFYNYKYGSTIPYKVLPEDQVNRVFDNSPRKARAQEVAGNRLIYGNYKINYNLPILNYALTVENKTHEMIAEYRNHTIKQNRNYQVGFVLADKQGRKSPVILAQNELQSHIFVHPLPATPVSSGVPWRGINLVVDLNNQISNPYSTRYVCTNPGGSFSVTDNTITISGVDATGTITSDHGNLNSIIGFYLTGRSLEYVEILSVVYDGTDTIITASDLINSVYSISSSSPFNLFKINKDGWYSYEIVVKQKEQEFYNVYTAGVVTFDNRTTWVTLAGDNINKVPRDLTLTQPNDGLYRSSTTLFPKLLAIANNSSSTPQHGPYQVSGTGYAIQEINIASIGVAQDEGLVTGSTAYPILYESAKTHLLAEISDPNMVYGMPFASSHYSTALTEEPNTGTLGLAEMQLSVFETKPVRSELDIFWETSTCGLVEELNYAVSQSYVGEGSIGITDIVCDTYNHNLDSNVFPEDCIEEDIIGRLSVVGGTGPFEFYKLDAFNDNNTTLNIVVDLAGVVQTFTRFTYKSFSVDQATQNFTLKVKVVDTATQEIFYKDLRFSVQNRTPYSIMQNPGYAVNFRVDLGLSVQNQTYWSNTNARIIGKNGSSINSLYGLSAIEAQNTPVITRYPDTVSTPPQPEFVISSIINGSGIANGGYLALDNIPSQDTELIRIETNVSDALGGINSLNANDLPFCATHFVRCMKSGRYGHYNLLTIEKPILVREFDPWTPNIGDNGFDHIYGDNVNTTMIEAGSVVADYNLGFGSRTANMYSNHCMSFRWYRRQVFHSIDDFADPSAPIGILGTPEGTLISSYPLKGNGSLNYNTTIGYLTPDTGNTLYNLGTYCHVLAHDGYSDSGYRYKMITEWSATDMVKMHYVRVN